jgi:hypothetical protein
MISSEVQRTLVKSPPELWTELSDPEALARHLAGLGEIKITRVEPEQLVEWEADGTTGSVAIKASGWGTKVTLTVNHELPEPEASSAEAVDETPEQPEQTAAPNPEEAPEQAAASILDEAPEDPAVAEAPDAMPIEPTPAPATEAARRAMGWPAAQTDAGPAIESDLRAAEAAEQAPDEVPPPAQAQEVPEDATDASDVHQPQPRRGFFARLFGRRRSAAAARAPEPPQQAEQELSEPALQQTNVEPAPSEAHDIEASSLGEEQTDTAPVVEAAPELQPEPALQHDPAPDPEGETAAAAEPAPAAAEPVEQDLAAELKAAEETAAEEVKAVLTGVLDRLGAAHHRPFSRA